MLNLLLDVIAGPMILLFLWPVWVAVLIIAVVVVTAIIIRRRKKNK